MTTTSPKTVNFSSLERMALRGCFAMNLAALLTLGYFSPQGQESVKYVKETAKEMTDNAKLGYHAFENYIVAQTLKRR